LDNSPAKKPEPQEKCMAGNANKRLNLALIESPLAKTAAKTNMAM
jgi:hypothetical protein